MKIVRKSNMLLFLLLLFIFLMASINYWNGNMTGEETDVVKNMMLSYSALVLVVYCLLLYLPIIKNGRHWIHKICFLWCVIMPLVMINSHNTHPSEYILTILWPLLFEVSYRICQSDMQRILTFRKLFVVVFVWGVLLLIQSRLIMSQLDHDQTNTIYFSLLTLPWIVIPDRIRTRIIRIAFFSLFALFSMKRSAMLVMAVIWVTYIALYLRQKRNKLLGIFFVIILLIVGSIVISRVNDTMGGRVEERMTEETDENSGRLAIWAVVITMIQESSLPEYIYGHGHFAVKNNMPFELSAHNDILEVIYDYGLIILILYLCLWWYIFSRCLHLYRCKSSLFLPYLFSFVIFAIMSMVSHLILYASYFNYLVVFWGCVEGLLQKEEMTNQYTSRLKSVTQRK